MKKWHMVVGFVLVVFSLIALIAVLAWGDDHSSPNPERAHQNAVVAGDPMGPLGFGMGPVFPPGLEQGV